MAGASALGMTNLALYTTHNVSATELAPTAFANIPPTSAKALQTLLQGNLRFQQSKAKWPNQTAARRQALAQKQAPLAIIFGCVDSRVPPELVFDQGLGDIFDIRTAGHVVDNAALGSIEFGVAELGVPLLLVLGHERCGAVSATIQAVDHHEEAPGSIQALVEYIRPSVLAARGKGDQRLESAVRNNILRTVNQLSCSKIICDAVKAGKLALVGCRYDLDTGAVSMLKK
jgi:carbonic anhydrase